MRVCNEAKFLMGAIAGAMAENGQLAYIADYPIFGTIANINAFALGAKMVNPRARSIWNGPRLRMLTWDVQWKMCRKRV